MKKENIFFAIASVVVAVLLWLQVQPMYEPGREREFAVPLKVQNLSQDLIVIDREESVLLVASGTSAELDKLDTTQVEAFVDLETAREGSNDIQIKVQAPANIDVNVRARKPVSTVALETVIREKRKVSVQGKGAADPDLLYNGATTLPDEVELIGPVSYVEKVKELVVTLDLAKISPGVTENLPVQVLDEEGRPVPYMRTEPANVTVRPSVAPAQQERIVPINVQWKGSPAFGYRVSKVEVEPSQIVLKGNSADLAGLIAIRTSPVDLSGLKRSEERTVALIIANGVSSEINSVLVKITIAKEP
ncbi:MAG: hypothetical protein KDC26_10225 [Armatimonadetes bacterium]|nr:hypothetical protein [Armatimonadota bacterium]